MPAVFDPSKPYQTVVDKEFAAFTAPKEPVSKPTAPVFDPNQPYEVVPEKKPVAPVGGGAQFNPDADFEKLYSLDEVKSKPEKELDEDKAFHPVEFGLQNQQALQSDPETLEKVLRIYQARETRGTTLAEKGAALVKGTPKVAKAIGKGAVTAIKQFVNLTFPPARLAAGLGAATVPGGLEAEQKRVAGEFAEVPASVEAAASGSGELLRRGGREIKEGAAGLIGGGKAALSPQDWRNRFFMDLAGLEQSQKAGQGNGAVLQALGNDAETLKQSGIELRPETIQELSVVTDPINWIPIGGAVAGVTKIGGRIATRVVAEAINPEQAAKLATLLNQAREAVTVGREAAGKGVQAVGTGVEKTGQVIQKAGETLAGPSSLATILGGDITKGLGVGIAVRATPEIIQKTGQAIKAGGEILAGTRPVPGVLQAAGQIAKQGAIGTGEGLLLSLPFELGARPEEEEHVLGATGVAGAVRSGFQTAKIAGAKAQDVLASQIFKQVEQAEAPPSATYGTEPALDTAHQAASAALPTNSQKLLNWTRELFRDSGVEVYTLDNKTFENQAGTSNAYGYAVNIGQKIGPDGVVTPVLRILLNADTEALPHELFHALTDLDPQGAKGLIDSVLESWTPEQKETFSDIYNTARNGGRPKSAWTTRLTDEAVGREAAAEVFSRLYLGQDLSGVAPNIKQRAALFASGILEKLGAPLGKVGAERGQPGVSTLGVRPGVEPTRVGQEWISNLLNRIREQGNILPEEPITSPLAGGEIIPGEISRRPAAQVPPTPTAPVPQPVPKVTPPPAKPAPTPARNIRVTREQQNDFAARRAEDLGIYRARAAASTPEATQRVNEVSASMEAGNPVLEIDHRGAIAAGTEKSPSGRTVRRAEQEAAYIAEGLGAAPESVRDRHQKTFVPVRWEIVNGKPQLLAMSLDKVIANVSRAVKDIVTAKQEARLPYEVDATTGKLTEAAWENVVSDLQAYTENQANGFRGDGKKLVRPTEDLQQSLPAENPGYNPTVLPEDKTNFLNLIQGLSPALTNREAKGRVPGAVKGAAIARAQGREPQIPSAIRPQDITKQVYKSGERILETNPLRNELAAAGVPVRELIEVTERINAGDILSVKERPDLQFEAPVTDIIRGGFLPKESAKRPEPYEPLRNLAKAYSESSGVPYRPEGGYVELANRPFAEQKNLVVPDELIAEAKGGKSEGQFLPKDQPVEKIAEEIRELDTAGLKAKFQEWGTSLTQAAYDVGRNVKLQADVSTLRTLREEAGAVAKAAIARGDFDTAMPAAAKSQFWQEAIEAATGEGGKLKLIRSALNEPEFTPPFPTEYGAQLPKAFEVPGRQISALDADLIQARGTPSKFWLNAKTGKILSASEGHLDVAKEILPVAPKEPAEIYDAMAKAGWVRGVNEGVGGIELNGPELSRPAKNTVEDIAFAARRPVKLNGESLVDPTAELLPKGLPDYLNFPEQINLDRRVRQWLEASGVTSQFWINGKTGKLLLAPDGHVETAREKILTDWEPNPESEDITADVYDEMASRGWDRGVHLDDGIELSGNVNLSRRAKDTLEDLAFKNKVQVTAEGKQIIERPGDFLPRKRDDLESRDFSKYNIEPKAKAVSHTGWILPDKTFVPLKQSYLEQYLAENSESLNEKFKTKFSDTADVEERLAALNAGFTRIRFENGKAHVEVNQKFWNRQKPPILDRLLSSPEDFDSVTVSILNNKGNVVDSQSAPKLFESENRTEDIQSLVDGLRAQRGDFLPVESEQTFKGFEPLTPEQRAKVLTKRKVNRTRESNPEAVLPKYVREEDGSLSLTAKGKPRPVVLEYELANTPLAREAAKGKRGAERETAITNALGKELVGAYRQAKKNKDLLAGSTWYSTARVRLRKLFGDDAKFFAELLGATSARTPVETNFRFALDAYNRLKSGEYDDLLAKYREGKSLWDAGDLGDFVKATKNEDPTRGQFLDWWVEKHNLEPVQSNEKKFGMNSRAVLRVLDGSWQSEVKGPKTPNFAGNLTGQTFEATIDVWAARALHRLANKGNEGRWRILPENETGVSDADFYIGQAAYRKAAEELGIKPDALQAVLWFAEKKHWEDRGWTRGAGAERSDFNTLLADTEKTSEGLFQRKKSQKELELE